MPKVIMVASYKGGVGKTTLSSALSYIAAEHGNTVTAVDLDLEFGGLDIALGEENSAGLSLIDVAKGVPPERARIPCSKEGLSLLCSPMAMQDYAGQISSEMLSEALKQLRRDSDLVVLDMPAGGGPFFQMLAESRYLDEVILVSTDAPTSLRAAEKCGLHLSQFTQKPVRLVVNSYHVDAPEENSAGLLDILNTVAIPALGVVPYDPRVQSALQAGRPVTAFSDSPAAIAVENIFMRLADEQVPLLSGVLKKKKRKKLYRSKEKM